MTDKNNLQKQLDLFKSQMKEVNESLYKFESGFDEEKAKIEKLRHSFFVTIKLINGEMIRSIEGNSSMLNNVELILKKLK